MLGMHPDPSVARMDALDRQAASMAGVVPDKAEAEARILWSASEGQVTNAGVFALALLLCWLVLPVAWALYCYVRTANHRYTLTDQRLLVESGIFVKRVETLELYRVKDLSCWRRFKSDQACRLNFDQGPAPGFLMPGCG